MEEQFTISTELNKPAHIIYQAWLNSKEHTAFTGGEAIIENELGSKFTAWDEYISGKIMVLDEGKKIVHSWRTVEFKEEEDSVLEVHLEDLPNDRCKITLHHSQLPEGGAKKYSIGWEENYFQPMRAYFK